MAFTKKEFRVRSSDGDHSLFGVVFLPERETKGYFHVVHGMTEHIGRYEKFMGDMADEGYICFGYDHLGHGKTANDDSELGFIAEKDGWRFLVEDVKIFSDAVFAEFGRTAEPYILMGHSMGSFIVRLAAASCVKPDRLIVMGTGGKNPAAGAGLALIGAIKAIRGKKHISKLVYAMAFGGNNKKFAEESDTGSWLTTDTEIRGKYKEDKFCSFKFTVSAMGDLIRLLKYSNSSKWYKDFPKDVPVLLVSGENDPIGNFGKGVKEVYDGLIKSGVNTKIILYKGARHEILNDFTYGATKADIVEFVDSEI